MGHSFGALNSIFKLGKLFKGGGGAGWIFGLILLASLFKKKKKPQAVVANTFESPTYSFGGGVATSIANDNTPIPIVFGKHMVGGNIVNSFISSYASDPTVEYISITDSSKIVNTYTSVPLATAIYKFVDCPVSNGLECVILIPKTANVFNANLNITVSVYYSLDNEVTYALGNTVPLNLHPTYTTNAQSITLGVATTLRIPVVTTSTQDVYIKTFINIPTIKSSNIFGLNNTSQYVNILNTVAKITSYSYRKSVNVRVGGAVNQKLFMDVVMSAGEIRNLHSVYVNDKIAEEHATDNKQTEVARGIKYQFRPGFSALPDLNVEGTLTFQSTVYNQSDTGALGKEVGSIMIQDLILGSSSVYLESTSCFKVGMKLAYNERTNLWGDYTVVEVYDNYIVLDTIWTAQFVTGTPIFIRENEQALYTNWEYTTQGEQIDGICIGLNAQNGLYNTNSSTGGLYNNEVTIKVLIAPAHLSSGTATAFPLTDATATIYNSEVLLRGAKRAKLWFDNTFIKELVPNQLLGEKKYLIQIQKLTDNSLSEYAKNDLQIDYVEELVNKELCYNGCAYTGMEITASSKVNAGTPNLRFDIDGVLIPQTLPPSIIINTASSTTTDIRTMFNSTLYGSASNYIVSSGTEEYQLNSPLVFDTTNLKLYSLLDDQSVTLSLSGVNQNKFRFLYNHFANDLIPEGMDIWKAYFKCGNMWYRRYVNLVQEQIIATASDTIENYRVSFHIPSVASVTATYLKVDTNWLAINNLALPSVPTDMVLYNWGDNPVWTILYMLCDEENGAAIPFSYIDFDSFRSAADYYDEWILNPITSIEGDMIKRCSVNYLLDSYQDLRSHLEKILTICHGALYNSNDKIKFLVEREVTDAEVIVSLDEELDLTDSIVVTSVPSKDMPTQLSVSYLDENDRYNKKNIIVEDPTLSKSKGYQKAIKQDIDMFGLTNESLVFMEAMKIIKAGRYTNFGIQIKTALSGLALEVYDVFELTSTTYGWTNKRFRVTAIKITDKKECEISAIEYFAEVYSIDTNDLIKYHEVMHTELPSLTEPPPPVSNITMFEEAIRNNDGSISVNLVGHFNLPQAIVYNASGTLVSNYNHTINRVDYSLVTLYQGATATATYMPVRSKVRFDGEEFRFNNLEIKSFYKVAVQTGSLANAVGSPVYPTTPAYLELTGKAVPPMDVTGFVIDTMGNDPDHAVAHWTAVTDTDLASYILKIGSSTSTYANATFEKEIPAKFTSCFDNDLIFDKNTGLGQGSFGEFGNATGVYKFYVKAKDSSGNESINATTVTKTMTLEPKKPINLFCESVELNNGDYPLAIYWDADTSSSTEPIISYNVKLGTSATSIASSTNFTVQTDTRLKITEKDKTKLSTPLNLFAYNGNLKIYIAAMDQYGNFSDWASATYALNVAPPDVTGLTLTPRFDYYGKLRIQHNEILVTSATDIAEYAFKSGFVSSLASASDDLSNLNGAERLDINTYNHEGETYKVFVAAVDKYDNYSLNWSSATHVVNVIPTHVSATDVSIVSTGAQLNLKLPQSIEPCFFGYEVHVSETALFTPDTTTLASIGKQTQLQIKSFGTPTINIEDSTTYYLKVRALSVVGNGTYEDYNSAWSEEFDSTTLDSTSPVIVITSTVPSTSPINVINSTSATVYYDISDNFGVDRAYSRCYLVGTFPPPSYADADFASSTFSPIGVDGDYIFQVKAYDVQSNMSSANHYFSVDTVSATAPVSVTASQLSSGGIQVVIDPAANINFKEYVVEYSVNGGTYAELRRTTTTLFIENITLVGTLQFKVKASKVHDAALDSDYTVSNELTLDLVGPSVVCDSQNPSIITSTLLTSNEITLHYLATDTAALKASSCTVYTLDSSAYNGATTEVFNASGTAASGTIVLTGLADGDHFFSLRAYDASGNSGNSSVQYFQVDTAVPDDNTAAVGSISNGSRTITWTIPSFSQCVRYANTNWMIYTTSGSVAYASATGFGESLTYTFTEDVQVFVKSRQVKSNGVARTFASCSNSSANVWIDSVPPQIAVTTISAIDSAGFCRTSPILVTATATDASSGILTFEYSLDNGVTYSVASNGSATSIALGASSTSKSLTFKALDARGNQSTWNKVFCYDGQGPQGLVAGSITSKFGRNIVWTFNASGTTDATSGIAGYEVRTADSGWGDSTYLYRGNEATFTQYPTVSSNVTIYVTQYDRAGNYGPTTASTAINLAPALVSSASVSATSEINGILARWSPVTTNSDSTVADDIEGYEYVVSYKDSAGNFIASTTQYVTQSPMAYVTFPASLLVANQTNSMKLHLKAFDVWGASSSGYATSTAFDIRQINGPDLAGNAFQLQVIKVNGQGTATANYSTTGQTIDTGLDVIVDGDFNNS